MRIKVVMPSVLEAHEALRLISEREQVLAKTDRDARIALTMHYQDGRTHLSDQLVRMKLILHQ